MANDVTLSAAAAAGLLSFLSPCVLPLVPPYLTFIAGTTIEDVATEKVGRARRDIFLAAVLFVAGFSTVFVALGATASFFGQVLRAHIATLSLLAGFAIIAMGLHFLGVFRLNLLYREKRLEVQKPLGLWGAYVMGLAFAFGWTPCIGPILAAILAIAASEATAVRGAGPIGDLFARTWHSVFACRGGSRAVPRLFEKVQGTFRRRRARCWRAAHCNRHRLPHRHDAEPLLLADSDFPGLAKIG